MAQPISTLLSLTYQEWGWVDSSNSLETTTLLSLLPATVLSSLSNVYILLAPLAYDSQIDLTALNQTLSANAALNYNRYPHGNFVRNFLGEFFEFFQSFLPVNDRFKRGPFKPNYRKPTAQSIYNDAVRRADKYVRTVGIRCPF